MRSLAQKLRTQEHTLRKLLNQELENSLNGDSVWEMSIEDFEEAWTSPEVRAGIIPAGVEPEPVNRWGVVIDRDAQSMFRSVFP